jgi:hypothetical protein
MLFGSVHIEDVELRTLSLNIERQDSTDNFSFLFKQTDTLGTVADSVKPLVNYRERSAVIFNALFSRIPESMVLHQFTFTYRDSAYQLIATLPSLSFSDGKIEGLASIREDSMERTLNFSGYISKEDHTIEAVLASLSGPGASLPVFPSKLNAFVGTDTLYFRFHQTESTEGIVLEGTGKTGRMTIHHKDISLDTVHFDSLAFEYDITIGDHYFEMDSNSTMSMNAFSFHPYLRVDLAPEKRIVFSVNKKNFPANELFASLPAGLFTTLSGLRASGNLSFSLYFDLNPDLPDSLKFFSDLTPHNFYVEKYGETNYTLMNDTFVHTVFERGVPVRDILVGPPNPGFTSLNEISPYLRYSVLCSEDGIFYYHNGFIPEAFRQSIVTNIKERRFARGGSTITMQLVKNVFLSRKKTIARKLEEVIIVWLIENKRLCSKDRMYEVYLNIIEWGPGIYGITEASQFYFSKKPSELNLNEALFLASIVPRPKGFKYSFDENGNIRDFVIAFQLNVVPKMLEKGWITQQEHDAFIPGVQLNGRANESLKELSSNKNSQTKSD